MDFYDEQLEGYQLSDLMKILTKCGNPDTGYTQKDSCDLIEKCELYIESIKNLILLMKHLKTIDFNYKTNGSTWNSYKSDKMDYYKTEFTRIKNKLDIQSVYSSYISTTALELFNNKLGDEYIHTIIPVLSTQCLKYIKIGFNNIRIQQELLVKSNLEKRWSCPICCENDNPAMGKFIWLVSEINDEKGNESCGHKIHEKCFIESYQYDSKCCLCRQEIIKYAEFRINWYRE